jgi:hypothetical protein
MRDKDYEQKPTPHTYRIALIGASHAMGWGVDAEKDFETLLENQLNSENGEGPYRRYEILNFAVSGYRPPQQLVTLEEKVFAFNPNAVFYVAHSSDMERTIIYLVESFKAGRPIPYDYPQEVLQKAIHYRGSKSVIIKNRLEPFRKELISWFYQRIVSRCREHQVMPVWILLPMTGENKMSQWNQSSVDLLRIAEEAGFVLIDLSDVYEGHEPSSVFLHEWDFHPNAKGHELIATKLYDALMKKKELFSFDQVANVETVRK